ncbi:TniQ family protein [Streptomyces sp. NPDC052012]|uniref:TniQ family protein n=1 Tax=Streptomyces sp. NPDC052012 TaxID=3155051 RepID=UPI00344D2E00
MTGAATGVQRVRPVSGEMTSSWLARLAHAYALSGQDLLRGILTGPVPPQITGVPRTGAELFLNSPARMGFSRFTGIPPDQLGGLLPEFSLAHERLTEAAPARAAWYTPRRSWVAACSACTARSGSGRHPVLVYPGRIGHICPRHKRWLLAGLRHSPAVDLTRLPEVLKAHHQHTTVVQRYPDADAVVGHAAAVVWSWQIQGWAQETVWARRTRILADLLDCEVPVVAAHPLITYPETVTVARLLGCPRRQRQLAATAAARGLQAAADTLYAELSRCTGRPWLADWLAACTRMGPPGRSRDAVDPLQCWLQALVHPAAGPGRRPGLWAVPPGVQRPVHYTDRSSFLCPFPARSIAEQARQRALTGGWQPPSAPCPSGRSAV